MLISATNALTLSPALCSVLLRPGHRSRGPMRYVLKGIDYARDGYAALVQRLVRMAVVGLVVLVGVAAASYLIMQRTPTGFLPEEDQGGFFINVQLPDAASIKRTAAVMGQVDEIVRDTPGVESTTAVIGLDFLDCVTQPNSGFFFVQLKPFEERTAPQEQLRPIMSQLAGKFAAIEGALVFPFNLPPIIGLGNAGGFQYVLESLAGADPAELASVSRRADHRRQPAVRAHAGLHDLLGLDPADLSQYRPREGPDAGGPRSTTSSPRCRPIWAVSS